MCRLLAVTAAAPVAIGDHLGPFAEIARNCREFQGHGWGCAWHEGGAWQTVPQHPPDLGGRPLAVRRLPGAPGARPQRVS